MAIPFQSMQKPRRLKIFLCHSSQDEGAVRDMYKKLTDIGYSVWWNKKKIIPGRSWLKEIENAIENADVVLICVSKSLTSREGFVQKEIKLTLDIREQKPDNCSYLIPVRIDDCEVPVQLRRFQWVDLFDNDGWPLLTKAIQIREREVGITSPAKEAESDLDDKGLSVEIGESSLISNSIQTDKKSFWDIFKFYQQSKLATEFSKNVTNILSELLKNYPGDVEKIAASQIKLLTSYYALVLNQAQRSFTWALVWATAGVLVFIASGAFLLINQSKDIVLIGTIGGAIVEVISGINFYLYNKASAQLADFHTRLDFTQKILLANAISEKIDGEIKQKTRSYLALQFAGVSVTPELLKREKTNAPNVRIVYIDYDPEGKDVDKEFVKIENLGNATAEMTDWVLQDNAGHKFKFPMFLLKPGTSVLLWTKTGKNTTENLFWRRKRAIWNNSGDCAYLKDGTGKLIDIYYYHPK